MTGAVPREAFWLPVTPGAPARVGSGANTSEVALPSSSLPETLPTDDDAFRALVRPLLVPGDSARPGGHFDALCAEYRPLWDGLAAFAGSANAPEAAPDEEDGGAREECLRQAAAAYPELDEAGRAARINEVFARHGIDAATATPDDYRRMADWLRRKAVPQLVRAIAS